MPLAPELIHAKAKKKRSPSSSAYQKTRSNNRDRDRPNPGPPNHAHRSESRATTFDALRQELSQKLGIPDDCRIYFLKKHDINNLPTTPRLRITFGNSVILDSDTWKVIQVNRFIPFSDMSEQKRKEMGFVVQKTYQHALARGTVEINSSVQGLKDWGEMRSAGYRPGSDKGRKFGVTAVNAKTGKSEELMFEDQERMLEMANINEILAESMSTLCLQAFESNRDLALKYAVPSFSDITWSESPNGNVIASNIVVTRDGFFNKSHQDFDESEYTYGWFTRIDRETGELHWVSQSEYLGDIEGVFFIMNEYHVEISLDSCDGIIESIWLSQAFHQTTASTTYDESWTPIKPKLSPITRYGCSLQINRALVKRIDGLLKLREGKSNEEWEAYKRKVVKCYEQEIKIKLDKIHNPSRIYTKKRNQKKANKRK